MVSWDHQRSGFLFIHPCIGRPLVRDSNLDPSQGRDELLIGPSARSLIAYMSGASLKKGRDGFMTTLDAGRLYERSGG